MTSPCPNGRIEGVGVAYTTPKPLPDFTDLHPQWAIGTPETAARLLNTVGQPTLEHHGFFWERHRLRFLTPVDHLQTHHRKPPPFNAGHWTTCAPEDATTRIAMILVTSLPGYGVDRLHKDVRHRIRRAAERADCVALTSPDLLIDQGWPLARQSSAHSGQPIPADETSFRRAVLRRFDGDPQLVIAAVQHHTLLAWMTGHAVGSTLRMTELCLGDRARELNLGLLLYWALLNRATTLPGIEVAHLGPWFPERPNLMFTKRRLGARLVDVPARGHIRAPLRQVLARTQPVVFQRWGGAGMSGHRPDELRDLPLWDPTRHRLSP